MLLPTLAQLLVDSKDAALRFGELGASSLVNYISSSNYDIQYNACVALQILSSYRGKLQSMILEAEGFPILLKLLQCPSKKILVIICDIIQNLSIDNAETRKAFCSLDAPCILTRCISSASASDPIRLILLQTLQTLCNHSGNFPLFFAFLICCLQPLFK